MTKALAIRTDSALKTDHDSVKRWSRVSFTNPGSSNYPRVTSWTPRRLRRC